MLQPLHDPVRQSPLPRFVHRVSAPGIQAHDKHLVFPPHEHPASRGRENLPLAHALAPPTHRSRSPGMLHSRQDIRHHTPASLLRCPLTSLNFDSMRPHVKRPRQAPMTQTQHDPFHDLSILYDFRHVLGPQLKCRPHGSGLMPVNDFGYDALLTLLFFPRCNNCTSHMHPLLHRHRQAFLRHSQHNLCHHMPIVFSLGHLARPPPKARRQRSATEPFHNPHHHQPPLLFLITLINHRIHL